MGDSVKSCFLAGAVEASGVVTCLRRAQRAFRSYVNKYCDMLVRGNTCSLSRSAIAFRQRSRSIDQKI